MSAKHILVALGAAIAVWAGAPAAKAQPTAPAPAGAAVEVDPQATALVRRLVKASGIEAQTDAAVAAILPVLAEREASRIPNLSASDRKALADLIREMMRDTFTPRMIEAMVPAYVETFSRAELEGLVAFYESPAGQAAVAKMPELMARSAAVTRALMPEAQAELVRRVCEQFDCTGERSAPPPADRS